MVDDRCMVKVRLPEWRIREVWAGEYASPVGHGPDAETPRWQAHFHWDRYGLEELRSAYRAVRAQPPAASGPFDVHRQPQALVYVREPCTSADVRDRFFLHLFAPTASADGADGEGAHHNWDFHFADQGAMFDGRCVAVVPLSALPKGVVRLRTGQFSSVGEHWCVELALE